MGKGDKDRSKGNRDGLLRINFLYQVGITFVFELAER